MELRVPTAPLSRRAPLFGAACALAFGMVVGQICSLDHLPLAFAGAALGRVPARSWSRLVSWALTGWILIHLAEEPWREMVGSSSEDRPVTMVGRISGCWEEGEEVWRARLHLRRVQQGGRVWTTGRRIHLYARDLSSLAPCGGVYRLRGYLRSPRRYENEPRIRVGGWSLFLQSPRLATRLEPPDAWARASARMRVRLFTGGEAESAGERLARALLTGERGRLPPRWPLGLQRWGLSHLLAVSGLHVGILALGVGFLAFPLPRTLRLLAMGLAVGLYLALAGPRPPLLRASVMFGLGAAAFVVRRPPSPLNAVSLAVLGLLVREPASVADVGFQLSVVATAGILLLGSTLARALQGLPAGLGAALGVTLAAQIATLPWAFSVFHRLPLLAPVANLLAGPWIAVTLVAAICWAGLRALLPGAEAPMAGVLDLLAIPVESLSSVPPSFTGSLVVDRGWTSALLLGGTAVAGIVLSCAAASGRRRKVLGACLLVACLLTGTSRAKPTADHPELVILDVGQGDGIVLRDGEESLVLDAGGWNRPGFGMRVVAPVLTRMGIRAPGALAISHGDRDHCGGISDLARELPVAALWIPAGSQRATCTRDLADMPWLEPRTLREGDVLRVGRWTLWVLGPAAGYRGDPNGGSLVLRAQIFDRCVLLTGDVDAAGERRLLARWPSEALRCDLLKVAHHGSKSSTTQGFLNAVRPRRALISVGRGNPYGHPAEPVLRRLERDRIQILRTDRSGMIRIRWPVAGVQWITTADG